MVAVLILCTYLQVTNLAWGAISFADGYKRTNTSDHVNDLIKWGADYLVASWNNQQQAFVAVLGNNSQDFNYYGPLEEYDYYVERPAFYINAQAPGVPSYHTRTTRKMAAATPLFTGQKFGSRSSATEPDCQNFPSKPQVIDTHTFSHQTVQ